MEERTDIKSEGFPWPGDWTVERDEARQKTTVHWKGKDGYKYPWGTEDDFESLTYDGDDVHPETCSVRGEAESIFALKGRTLTWRGHLLVTTDQKNFYYKYTRELLEGWSGVEDEDLAGDDSPRSSVGMPCDEQGWDDRGHCSFALSGLARGPIVTRGLRRGLHSFAASRLYCL